MPDKADGTEDFTREAAAGRTGLLREFWDFLKDNKKWWLLPILIALLAVGVLVLLGGTSLAPLIYTIF